jgi:hypothetical protein
MRFASNSNRLVSSYSPTRESTSAPARKYGSSRFNRSTFNDRQRVEQVGQGSILGMIGMFQGVDFAEALEVNISICL